MNNLSLCSKHSWSKKPSPKRERERELTDYIDCGLAIREPPGRTISEVDAVWQVVGSGQGTELVVVPVVHQRVPKYEVARHLRVCTHSITVQHRQQQHTHQPQNPPSAAHLTLHH